MVDWRLVARVSCPFRGNYELLIQPDGMAMAKLHASTLLAHYKTAVREAGLGDTSSKVKWESCV